MDAVTTPTRTDAIRHLLEAVLPETKPEARVALVAMPFWATHSPSIQLGLLKAILQKRGIASTVHYLNVPFARLVGYTFYSILADVRTFRLGEWLFSEAAFSPRDDDEKFLEEFSSPIADILSAVGWTTSGLLELKRLLIPEYVEACLEAVPWDNYGVVGFTSTFQQHTPCLAIARRIKERYPQVKVVMGGANLEGEMGLESVRAFQFIDFAVIGEGDAVFPTLVEDVLNNRVVQPRPGLAMRSDEGVLFNGPAPMVADLTDSPVPNYDEFFETGGRLGLFEDWQDAGSIRLPFESSRGCWWGERNHCTFCGLNGLTMKFRAKTPQQVLGELAYLSDRYKWTKFQAVDNIMEYPFMEVFCSAIEEKKYDLDIFYELKSNMSRSQVQKLRHAGICRVQPGIESLSSNILRLMKKGVKGIHNVELLKWTRYYGIYAGWNMLLGFPGEQLADCEQQVQWAKCISHLQPPDGIARIWLERFSPYYTRPDLYPVSDVKPERSYYYAYPDDVNTAKIAYFFNYKMDDTLSPEQWQPLYDEVNAWQIKWKDKSNLPSLTYKNAFDRIFIADNRDEWAAVYTYSGAMAALYLFCESRKPLGACLTYLQEQHGGSESLLNDAISDFVERRLMIREENVVLSLALPENRQW